MNATTISLLSGFISGAITAIITYFATRSKAILDLTIEHDRELRKERLDAYQKLWPQLKPLARYSAERPLSYEIVKETSEKMRDWYFSPDGIFLSARSRGPYFDLKAEMQKVIDDADLRDHKRKLRDTSFIKTIHAYATDLRASLSDDVGTRRRPFI